MRASMSGSTLEDEKGSMAHRVSGVQATSFYSL